MHHFILSLNCIHNNFESNKFYLFCPLTFFPTIFGAFDLESKGLLLPIAENARSAKLIYSRVVGRASFEVIGQPPLFPQRGQAMAFFSIALFPFLNMQ